MLRLMNWPLLGSLVVSAGCSAAAGGNVMLAELPDPPEVDDKTTLTPFVSDGVPPVGFVEVDCDSSPGASAVATADA
jgi:hypothetical protein